ncbi:MAG: hypothetical protein LBG72_09615 [Spirochaetaceae bacterium]|jgi:hypothetical protein|nr:hypothetical protein [Spirochaetaceae bacterium]
MIAVKGIYEGGNTVKIDDSEFTAAEPCEVVITFLHDAKNAENKRLEEEKKRKAFASLMKYHKTLRADFDYKKELAEWRDERYGSAD